MEALMLKQIYEWKTTEQLEHAFIIFFLFPQTGEYIQ